MSNDQPYEALLVDRRSDGVAVVTLNRPDKLNSFNLAMRADFRRLWAEVRADDDVRSVVLRAAGERAFSTGLDVTERTSDTDNPWVDTATPWSESEDPGQDLGPKRNEVWKPVVAAVRGMCAGGAFYWISECDIVICSPEATFFDPHVTYGMVAAIEPIAMSYRMHLADITRMALLGLHERMSAERALACGLVTEVVEDAASTDDSTHAGLDERAVQLAAAMASQPAVAVQGTVKAIWQAIGKARADALSTALLYTQVGNPIATADLDRSGAKPGQWWVR